MDEVVAESKTPGGMRQNMVADHMGSWCCQINKQVPLISSEPRHLNSNPYTVFVFAVIIVLHFLPKKNDSTFKSFGFLPGIAPGR